MKKFFAWVSGMDQTQQALWQEAGFDIYVPERYQSAETAIQQADIIWLCATNGRNSHQAIEFDVRLKNSFPKIFFLCNHDKSTLPHQWFEYQHKHVSVDGIDWVIGSQLEEPLPAELLEYFAQQKTTELLTIVYMTLLASVFRETAEWCGHMSSVVGRM